MSTRFYITIDTEEDDWGTYNSTGNTVENIQQLPRLQALFDRYGAIPTYLINYPVATDIRCKQILEGILKSGNCEIGTQCHPWNTPPHIEKTSAFTSMMCNLPEDLIAEKMGILHEVIKTSYGSPTSFRAGRWGFNSDVARCIASLGYKLDTSISPFVDWSKFHGPDFSNARTTPYRFDPDDIFAEIKKGSILEVPPTIGFCQKNTHFTRHARSYLANSKLSKLRLIGLLDKLRIINFYWLSPELSNAQQMIRLCNSFISSGHNFLNMTFHSTTLLPGSTPFVTSDDDLEDFLNRIESVLEYASENGFIFSGISEHLKAHY